MIFNLDFNPPITGNVGSVKPIRRKWAIWELNKPVGMLDYPARIDAHVIRHHVAAHANSAQHGAIAQVEERALPTKIIRHDVIIERVSGRGRFGISRQLLDTL